MCDCIISFLKCVVRCYCNEGYDILLVVDMYGVFKVWLVKGCIVVVCEVDWSD